MKSIQTIQRDFKAKVKDDNTKLITETIRDNSVVKTRVKEKDDHTNTAIDVNTMTITTRVGSPKTQLSTSPKEKGVKREKQNSEVSEEKVEEKAAEKARTTTERESQLKRTT